MLVAGTLLGAPAHAGRPLQTEDAGVLDRGSCEIEGAYQRVRDRGGSTRGDALVTSCGIGLSSQVGLGVARGGGVGLLGKTRLWTDDDDDDDGAALTLAWTLDSRRVDGRRRHSADDIRLALTLPAGPGSVHLNAGYARDRIARESSRPWALAYEHEGYDVGRIRLQPMAELFGQGGGSRWWNVALRATLAPERLFVDASYGRQFGDGQARLVTVGFKVAF